MRISVRSFLPKHFLCPRTHVVGKLAKLPSNPNPVRELHGSMPMIRPCGFSSSQPAAMDEPQALRIPRPIVGAQREPKFRKLLPNLTDPLLILRCLESVCLESVSVHGTGMSIEDDFSHACSQRAGDVSRNFASQSLLRGFHVVEDDMLTT
jgi:hypothetical protein